MKPILANMLLGDLTDRMTRASGKGDDGTYFLKKRWKNS
jgi:hypothetical protein